MEIMIWSELIPSNQLPLLIDIDIAGPSNQRSLLNDIKGNKVLSKTESKQYLNEEVRLVRFGIMGGRSTIKAIQIYLSHLLSFDSPQQHLLCVKPI